MGVLFFETRRTTEPAPCAAFTLASWLLLLASFGIPAHAQFFVFLADWSEVPPSDARALTADITAALKARSPWGEITNVESGKYWRNGKGQDRFDNAYGTSELRDRRGPVIHVRIDRTLRLVDIEEKMAAHVSSSYQPDAWNTLPVAFKKTGQKMVDGLSVTVRTGEDNGVRYEVWTEDELGLILFAQYKTDQTVFEQRVHNIRFEEPVAGVVDFRVPESFATHITCWSIGSPVHEAPRQTYQPRADLCGR